MYHYKNRAYHPGLMRFLQADPIGVSGGINLYAYVGGDPMNLVDPWGLSGEGAEDGARVEEEDVIVVNGTRIRIRGGGARGLDVPGGGGYSEPLISPELQAVIDALGETDGCQNSLAATNVPGPGSQVLLRDWSVSPTPEHDGVIIQGVVVNYSSGRTDTYYEVWQVQGGTGNITPSAELQAPLNIQGLQGYVMVVDTFHDQFNLNGAATQITGVARYYPGQSAPANFGHGVVIGAGAARATRIPPQMDGEGASCPITASLP